MSDRLEEDVVRVELEQSVFERTPTVSTLVAVGTVERGGAYDFAPKHMALPLGGDGYFGFVCTPRHSTYQNAQRDNCFTVSFPGPDQISSVARTASSRDRERRKPALQSLDTVEARSINGAFLKDAYLFLECEVDRIIDDFGEDSLVAGRIVAQYVNRKVLLDGEQTVEEILRQFPLIAYVHPGLYARVDEGDPFPFPEDFHR